MDFLFSKPDDTSSTPLQPTFTKFGHEDKIDKMIFSHESMSLETYRSEGIFENFCGSFTEKTLKIEEVQTGTYGV